MGILVSVIILAHIYSVYQSTSSKKWGNFKYNL